MKKGFVVGALLVLMFALAAGAQNGRVVSNNDVPVVALTLPDSCTNEDVTYDGDFELLVETFSDESGGFHTRVHQVAANVIGIGNTSKLPYRLVVSGTTIDNVSSEGFPQEMTISFKQKQNGLGPLPNEQITTFFHITVNRDGIPTSELDKGTVTKCTGTQ